MNDLIFIRHAETDLSGTFCGQADPPVNAAGQLQIQKLVDTLRSEPIVAVYSSDLQRAITTAHALAESLDVPLIKCDALREIYFGRWEGLTWKQIEELDSTYAANWLEEFPKLPALDGELLEDFEDRVMEIVLSLISQSKDKTVAIVSHAGVMRTILRTLCGVDEREAWTRTKAYCCTFRYSGSDRRVLEEIG